MKKIVSLLVAALLFFNLTSDFQVLALNLPNTKLNISGSISKSVIDNDGNAVIDGDYLLAVNTGTTAQSTGDLSSLYKYKNLSAAALPSKVSTQDMHRRDYHPDNGDININTINKCSIQKSTMLSTYTAEQKKVFRIETMLDSGTLANFNARAAYVGTNCVVWVHDSSANDAFSAGETVTITNSNAQSIGNEFDKNFPTMISNFGNFYNADGSNKVSILVYNIRDGFSGGSYVAGYFSGADLIPLYSNSSDNNMPMINIDTYPTISYNGSFKLSNCYSTLFHEFQHMINFSIGYSKYSQTGFGRLDKNDPTYPYNFSQDTYINEMMSMSTEQMLGYDGVKTERLDYYNDSGSSDISNGFSLTQWDRDNSLPNYSLSYLFGQYLVAQTGNYSIFSDIAKSDYYDDSAITQAINARTTSALYNKSFNDIHYNYRTALALNENSGISSFNGSSISSSDTINKNFYPITASTTKVSLLPGASILLKIQSGITVPLPANSYVKYYGIKAGAASIPNTVSGIPDANLYNALLTYAGKQAGDLLYADDFKDITSIVINNEGKTEDKKIASLSGLDKLNLSSLTKLDLSGNKISDLTPLTKLINLTSLYLNDNNVAVISALSGMTRLTDLELCGNKLTNLTPITNLTTIKSLNISENSSLTSLASISKLVNLEYLNIDLTKISDISVVKNFIHLKKIHASNCQIADISPVAGVTSLEALYFDGNQIKVLPNLRSLVNIKPVTTNGVKDSCLELKTNFIPEIYFTSAYLPDIYVSDTQWLNASIAAQRTGTLIPNSTLGIADKNLYNALLEITKTTNLYSDDLKNITDLQLSSEGKLDSEKIVSLKGLEKLNLSKLGYLNLRGNKISDITPLSNLTDLKNLYLSFNNITNISALNSMTKLEYLELNGNTMLTNLAPISNIKTIKSIHIMDTNISDISPLSELINLTELWADNCKIADITPIQKLTQLQILHLSNNIISSLPDFRTFTNLKDYVTDANGKWIATTFTNNYIPAKYLTANYLPTQLINNQTWLAAQTQKPNIPATAVTVSPIAVNLVAYETKQLNFTVLPAIGTLREVTWSSSNNEIATVDADGLVTAHSKGIAVITATTGNGKTAKCTISVSNIPVIGVTLNAATSKLEKGNILQLTPTISPAEANEKRVTWTTSNERVAIVDTEGKVTAISSGTATITARTVEGSKTAICIVNVDSTAKGLVLSSVNGTINKGQILRLTALVTPSDTVDKTVTWSVTNTDGKVTDDTNNIITVDQTGKVTAVGTSKVKSAIVWATPKTGKKAGCVITVNVPVTSIAISPSYDKNILPMTVGKPPVSLTATVQPTNADVQGAVWTSSNINVATVGEDGLVTPVGKGTAVITVKSIDGNRIASVIANVTQPVTGLSLNYSNVEIGRGKTITLVPAITPITANDKTITWSIKEGAVSGITLLNGKVTAASDAPDVTATIVATANGGLTAECVITVVNSVTALAIDGGNQTLYLNGTDAQKSYSYKVKDENGNVSGNVTWKSSNPNVATVDANGKVTSVGKGTAVITAAANDGSLKSASVTVAVKKLVESITLSQTSVKLAVGKTATIIATVSPIDADLKTIKWSSSIPEKVTVTNGLITVKNSDFDTAAITAEATDGSGAMASVAVKSVAKLASAITIGTTSNTLISNATGYTIDIDKTGLLNAVVTDKDKQNTDSQEVTWTSSNPTVLSIDKDGNVTANEKGTAIVTAAATDGSGIKATKTITVNVPVTGVTINSSGIFISKGRSFALKATINPANANNLTVNWTAAGDSSITVDEKTGLVKASLTAESGKTATVTATTADGSKTATCLVTIVDAQVAALRLDKTVYSFESPTSGAAIGKACQLAATLTPATATTKNVSWASDNESVVTVDANGKVTSTGYGTTKVTATTKDGQKTASCTFTVYPVPVSYVLMPLNSSQNIELKNTTGTTDCNVEVVNQYFNAITNNIKIDNSLFTYTSSNENVATVDATGKVTAADNGIVGITTITAVLKGDPANRQVTFTVSTMSKQVKTIEVSYDIVKIDGSDTAETKSNVNEVKLPFVSGQRIQLTATQKTANGSIITANPIWTSADPTIATVIAGANGNAVVTLRKAGSTTIKVKANDTFGTEKSISIYAYDFTPKVSGTIALNKNTTADSLTYSSSPFEIATVFNTKINSINVKSVKIGTTYLPVSGFSVVNTTGNNYVVKMTDTDPSTLKAGAYTITAEATIADKTAGGSIFTATGEATQTAQLTLVVNVVEIIPTVTVEIPTMNLFYTDAKYPLTINAGSETVKDVKLSDNLTNNFKLENTAGVWYISRTANAFVPTAVNGTVSVTLNGYTTIIENDVTISTVTTTPVLTPTPSMVTINSGSTKTANFTITNSTDKVTLKDFDISLAANQFDNNSFGTPIVDENGVITLSLNGEVTNKTYIAQASIKKDNWANSITVKLSVTVKNTGLTAALSSAYVTLNNNNTADKAAVNITPNQSNVKITDVAIDYYKLNVKQDTLPAGMIAAFDPDTSAVTVNFTDTVPATGSYTFKLTPNVGSISLTSLTLTVRVVSIVPTVTMTRQGSIDLINRDGSGINYGFKVLNTSAAVKNAEITDPNYSASFTGSYSSETGLFTVKANKDADLQTINYKIPVKITLYGGYVIYTSISFVPVQTIPTLQDVQPITFYKDTGDAMSADISFAVAAPSKAEISLIQNAADVPDDFSVKFDGAKVTITATNPTLKPGTYTFSFNVYFKGAATSELYPNGVPVLQTVTVIVK